MVKATMLVLAFSVMVMSSSPSPALAHYTSGIEPVGERTASFLASPFVAAFDPAPLTYPPPVYVSPPLPPPGLCRWERIVLDNNGRPVLDQTGKPVKEYAIGSCQQPPY
ncbi:hypothetical protein [uncultured Desulfobulbus sp.]|uniref:hypothetical protein n=1 Tax=uncultured Desulfobulbus sp. TaxID=239745 RepID=UPI0029C61203|nr:hypothetical protein [uncultured Desulfobulbus sp.]